MKDSKEDGFPWEALGAGLASVLLFFLLTLRFRMPPLIGLGASLALSSLVFLGVLRLRKILSARSSHKSFSLREELRAAEKARRELASALRGEKVHPSLRQALEDLTGALDLMASALETEEEPEVLASYLKVHQSSALRLVRLARLTAEPEHLERIKKSSEKLAENCRRHHQKVTGERLLEVEAELEVLETTLG